MALVTHDTTHAEPFRARQVGEPARVRRVATAARQPDVDIDDDFANRAALVPGPDNVFDAGTQAPTQATGKVAQRMLEDSNVNTIMEMTNMIQVTRNYQTMQRFLDSEHERQRRAISSITANT